MSNANEEMWKWWKDNEPYFWRVAKTTVGIQDGRRWEDSEEVRDVFASFVEQFPAIWAKCHQDGKKITPSYVSAAMLNRVRNKHRDRKVRNADETHGGISMDELNEEHIGQQALDLGLPETSIVVQATGVTMVTSMDGEVLTQVTLGGVSRVMFMESGKVKTFEIMGGK